MFFVALLTIGFASATPSTASGTAGTTWTAQTSAADNAWRSVTYGNGLFVAVSSSGTGNRVMTSPDGITWTARTAADNSWNSVTYGNGLFVAVSGSGTGNRVMTSGVLTPAPDESDTTPTPTTTPASTLATTGANAEWLIVTGLLVAIAGSGFLALSRRKRTA